MKNQIYLLFLSLFFCVNVALGQSSSWGVTGQMGISQTHQLESTENYQSQPLFSGNFGLFFKYKIAKQFNLSTELLYTRTTSQIKGEDILIFGGGIAQESYTDALNFISIPILIEREIGDFYLNGGIQSMIFLNGQTQHYIREVGMFGEYEGGANFKTELDRKFDYGLKFGLGYQISTQIALSINGYWGFSNLSVSSSNYLRVLMNKKIRQGTVGINYTLEKPKQ